MLRSTKIALVVFLTGMLFLTACQKNYYTSKSKGNDCGCPNKKGMVGY